MDEIRLGDQVIRYDRNMTLRAYSAMTYGDADRCSCAYCRNYAAQRQTALPIQFLEILDRLGIDPAKEGEVYECGVQDELRNYGGWFYFAGELVESGERLTDTARFQFWCKDAKHVPKPPVDFGSRVLALEFYTKLPWVISEDPDD